MSATPSTTSRVVSETKYGKIIRVRPQTSGTTLICLLPYTRKPSPIEPNSNPQKRADVSKAPNGEVERPPELLDPEVSEKLPNKQRDHCN